MRSVSEHEKLIEELDSLVAWIENCEPETACLNIVPLKATDLAKETEKLKVIKPYV